MCTGSRQRHLNISSVISKCVGVSVGSGLIGTPSEVSFHVDSLKPSRAASITLQRWKTCGFTKRAEGRTELQHAWMVQAALRNASTVCDELFLLLQSLWIIDFYLWETWLLICNHMSLLHYTFSWSITHTSLTPPIWMSSNSSGCSWVRTGERYISLGYLWCKALNGRF